LDSTLYSTQLKKFPFFLVRQWIRGRPPDKDRRPDHWATVRRQPTCVLCSSSGSLVCCVACAHDADYCRFYRAVSTSRRWGRCAYCDLSNLSPAFRV